VKRDRRSGLILRARLMPDGFEPPEVRMLRPEGFDLPGGWALRDGWLDRALDGR
jgi:LysR family hydrogen peroxide-inducible transcriptional activator